LEEYCIITVTVTSPHVVDFLLKQLTDVFMFNRNY